MPDDPNPAPQPPSPQPIQPAQAQPDAGHLPITEELDSAKWTLPPLVPVAIALVAIVIIVAVVAYTNRPTPSATGSITKVISADQRDNTMVAVHLKFDNQTDKPLWIKNISSEVETAEGKKLTDTAAPASDMVRYLQAFPVLAEGKVDPLQEEQKIAPKGSHAGMTVFSYPVDKKTFDGRKSLSVRVEFYDRAPMVLKQ